MPHEQDGIGTNGVYQGHTLQLNCPANIALQYSPSKTMSQVAPCRVKAPSWRLAGKVWSHKVVRMCTCVHRQRRSSRVRWTLELVWHRFLLGLFGKLYVCVVKDVSINRFSFKDNPLECNFIFYPTMSFKTFNKNIQRNLLQKIGVFWSSWLKHLSLGIDGLPASKLCTGRHLTEKNTFSCILFYRIVFYTV